MDASAEASERVELAIAAWRKGDWTEVRHLLEPLVRDGDGIKDALLRESALRYLAEGTLLDQALALSDRTELARGYIERLFESSPDWSPPSGLHGRAFYDLVGQIRSERDQARAEACSGKLLACQADRTELEFDHRSIKDAYAKLEAEFQADNVALRDVIKRNRGLALLPLGIGHFTNDNYALGGTFLGLEIATGAVGLGLLIYRIAGLGCARTNGFADKSLVCIVDARDDQLPGIKDYVEKLRKAEEVMGYLFIGSIVVDIVVAQALFKPITIVDRGQVPRSELGKELQREAESDDNPGKRKAPNAKLKLLPHPAFIPRGVGFGVTLQF